MTAADSAAFAAVRPAIEQALALVDDPCSIAVRAPLNVLELGLIRDWRLDGDGQVHVTISPTAPSCILIGSIIAGIERRVGEVPGVAGVQVCIDTDTVWSPGMMTQAGRDKLQRRRAGSMASVPVRPRQWQEGT